MMIQALSVLLVIISGILCSGTQQGVSSTQSGQALQIQPNVRKYNKHTATEKPCTTGSTTGTRKDKPDGSDIAQDYVPIGGPAGGAGYSYPYPYPYPAYPYPYPYPPVAPVAPGGVVLVPGGNPQAYRPPPQPYPYDPQYPVEAAPYYPPPSTYYPAAGSSPLPPPPPPYYAPGYPPASQSLYDQSVVVDAYRSPQPSPPYPQPATVEQQQFFRQPAATVPPYYYNNNNNYAPPPPPSPHFRAHAAYNRPSIATQSYLLQQRDATATATAATNTASAAAAANGNANNNAEPQYEQQQSGPFDSNQFHF